MFNDPLGATVLDPDHSEEEDRYIIEGKPMKKKLRNEMDDEPRSVDIRPVQVLPPHRRVERVLVITPEELIVQKVLAYHQRRDSPNRVRIGEIWRCSC